MVLAVILILVGALVTVGRSRIAAAKKSETQGMLQTLQLAAQQFAEEKPLSKVKGYRLRYGDYPPDELDGFVGDEDWGIPGSTSKISQNHLNINKDSLKNVRNGDIKAFALAVRSYNQTGAAILDRIQPKYRAPAHKGADGMPDEYLDRNGDGQFTAGQDEPLDYFIDTWGTPVAYFATADTRTDSAGNPIPSQWDNPPNVENPGNRVRTCQALRSLSNDTPVFVSYGPDAPEQFSEDFRVNGFWPDLIYDFNEGPANVDQRIEHPMNQDNIYSNETVREKILQVSFTQGVLQGGG